ncbi:MAG: alpha/beta fold hydrolase, partial [Chloroflexota bacterium]
METSTLQTPDGVTIHTVHWSPETDSERVVMLVHGISEHSGRYAHVAEHLTSHGYHVYAHDHRGHGKSTGDRVHAPSNTAYITDLKLYYDRIKRTHPNANIYMIG